MNRKGTPMKSMLILMTLSGHTYMPVPYTPVLPSQDTLTPEDRAIPFRAHVAQQQCVTTCYPGMCLPGGIACDPTRCVTTCR